MPRWNVEIKPDDFEDVGADSLRIIGGGVLAFFQDDEILVAYAPGAWLTVGVEEAS